MHAVHICTVHCQQHFSPHTHNSQCCCLYGSLSKAPQTVGLNERRQHSVQVHYINTASWLCVSAFRKSFLSVRFPPHPGLQWVASDLRSLSSTHKWEEWIPERICSGGRLCHLSPRHLQPNTLAPMAELVRENKHMAQKLLFIYFFRFINQCFGSLKDS